MDSEKAVQTLGEMIAELEKVIIGSKGTVKK